MKISNNQGIALITVLMISIAMMVLGITILSTNLNQILSGKRQIDRIKAEEYAQGEFWKGYAAATSSGIATGPTTPTAFTEVFNGKPASKTYTANIIASGTGPNNTQRYNVSVDY